MGSKQNLKNYLKVNHKQTKQKEDDPWMKQTVLLRFVFICLFAWRYFPSDQLRVVRTQAESYGEIGLRNRTELRASRETGKWGGTWQKEMNHQRGNPTSACKFCHPWLIPELEICTRDSKEPGRKQIAKRLKELSKIFSCCPP